MDPDDDRVGYGRPPKATRFQPGQSGNPAGRPKGRRKLSADLREELAETIKITEGGREVQVSKQRAIVKALVAESLNGNLRAIGLLSALQSQAARVDEEEEITVEEEEGEITSEEDRDIVGSFTDRDRTSETAGSDETPSLLPPPSERT